MKSGDHANAVSARPATRLAAAPLYILSFRQRDELATAAARAGWHVIAARRAEGAERRFLATGAMIAVVDARGRFDEGKRAAAGLGDALAANGGALLVLVSRDEAPRIGEMFDAGATHFHASPFGDDVFLQALRFAERFVERVSGGWHGAADERQPGLGWSFDPRTRALAVTRPLAQLLDLPDAPLFRDLLTRIDRADRRRGHGAVKRLTEGAQATAFAHELPGSGRVVQHLRLDRASGRIEARIEPLDAADTEIRDALTGAQDSGTARRWLDIRLASGLPVAAILVALSRFDMVNTAYGRASGDALLRSVARRIDDVVRAASADTIVARMGGSEFLIALAGDPAGLDLLVAAISEAIARPFVSGETIAALGCRIGVAGAIMGDDAGMVLRRASEALAEAKSSDHATVRVAIGGEGEHDRFERLAVDLRGALDRSEIEILFQPQIEVATGAMIGVEALARWAHPMHGTIGAELLFGVAERADLGIALSDHVQRLVLALAARWPEPLAPLRLSLNLTAADVTRPGFADVFLDRVDTSGFPRARLTVEITETGLIEDLGTASALFAQLRAAGLRVAIDDFGTGYSSLAYLKALPLDYLKIDKRLAQDIAGSTRDRVVVRGVIEMARSLGLCVIAEGVETERQLDLLAEEGCQIYQGFLCSGPVTVAALTELVKSSTSPN